LRIASGVHFAATALASAGVLANIFTVMPAGAAVAAGGTTTAARAAAASTTADRQNRLFIEFTYLSAIPDRVTVAGDRSSFGTYPPVGRQPTRHSGDRGPW
jgi:hypothetical protein